MEPIEVKVAEFFDQQQLEAIAVQSGFVQRRSRINGMRFLLTFTAGVLNTPDGTLTQLAAFLTGTCGAAVSPQAVDQRINPMAHAFLGKCLAAALKMSGVIKKEEESALDQFDHVYVIDSTNFSLHPALSEKFKGSGGGGSAAAMRIQFLLDYRTETMHIELGDVKLADSAALAALVQKHSLPQDGVCLYLADLGYFKITTFANIQDNPDHHFLSKLQFGVKLLKADGTDLDLEQLLKSNPAEFDLTVKLGDKTCRLVGRRLPEETAGQKIRRANKDSSSKSGHISEKYRRFLHYALFITSLPPKYGMEQLYTIYRIRWQVELVFKVWKSVLSIHRIRSAKEDRVLCEVKGKLIVAVLISMISANARAVLDGVTISFHKAARYIRALAINWAQAIQVSTDHHYQFLLRLKSALVRSCRKTSSKKKPSIEQRLKEALPNEIPPVKKTGKC